MGLAAILKRCWEMKLKEPRDRYGCVTEFVFILLLLHLSKENLLVLAKRQPQETFMSQLKTKVEKFSFLMPNDNEPPCSFFSNKNK